MQNPASEIFIFDSTGRHLNGKTDASKYLGLARQLSAKMNALHFESTGKEGEFILGCSLRVEQVDEGEERVFFIAVYNSGSTLEIIDSFYSDIKTAICDLDKVNYRIIGLWEEGDLETLKQVSVPEEMMQYVFGKILSGERVAIRSGDPAAGISLIRQISGYLGPLPAVKLVLSVSQYPVDNNVSISPKEPKPDFELDGADITWKQIPAYKDYYLLLAKTTLESPMDVNKYPSLNLINLSIHIKNKAFQNYRDDILEMFVSTPSSVNKFFELYINDKEAFDVFVRYWSNLTTQPLPINDKLAGLIIHICSKKDTSYPSNHNLLNSESEAIKRIYTNIRSSEAKKAVDNDLLKNNIFLSYAIKDTINRIYKEKDTELLDALFNVSFSDDLNFKEQFRKTIDAELFYCTYEDLLSLLRTIANIRNSEPGEGAKVFLKSLISIILNSGYHFNDDLTKKEAENLERFFGKVFFSQKQQAYKENNSKEMQFSQKTTSGSNNKSMELKKSYFCKIGIHRYGIKTYDGYDPTNKRKKYIKTCKLCGIKKIFYKKRS